MCYRWVGLLVALWKLVLRAWGWECSGLSQLRASGLNLSVRCVSSATGTSSTSWGRPRAIAIDYSLGSLTNNSKEFLMPDVGFLLSGFLTCGRKWIFSEKDQKIRDNTFSLFKKFWNHMVCLATLQFCCCKGRRSANREQMRWLCSNKSLFIALKLEWLMILIVCGTSVLIFATIWTCRNHS